MLGSQEESRTENAGRGNALAPVYGKISRKYGIRHEYIKGTLGVATRCHLMRRSEKDLVGILLELRRGVDGARLALS